MKGSFCTVCYLLGLLIAINGLISLNIFVTMAGMGLIITGQKLYKSWQGHNV